MAVERGDACGLDGGPVGERDECAWGGGGRGLQDAEVGYLWVVPGSEQDVVDVLDGPVFEMDIDVLVCTSGISQDGADILDAVVWEGREYGCAAC